MSVVEYQLDTQHISKTLRFNEKKKHNTQNTIHKKQQLPTDQILIQAAEQNTNLEKIRRYNRQQERKLIVKIE